jgi:transposase-like protein
MDIKSFMPSEVESLKTLREIRWAEGIKCIYCGSERVVKTGMHGKYAKAQRYHCKNCDKWFNDKTGTIFENSNLLLRYWFFAAFLMQFKVSIMEISKTLGVKYDTAFNMVKKLRKSIYAKRIPEKLTGTVEIDEIYITAGLKGKKNLARGGRERGLKARGRGSYAKDKPPVLGMVERKGKVRLFPQVDVKSKRVLRRFLKNVADNAQVYTDDFSSYDILPQGQHLSVNHSNGEYSNGNGVHINTVEAEFSVYRPWMATFRGVSKENLYLYCSHYEFSRNNRCLHPVDRVLKLVEFLHLVSGFWVILGSHRLTLCDDWN